MSRHTVVQEKKRYVFGWDKPLVSFFLQVHDLTKDEDDEDRIPVWLGATEKNLMYDVAELVQNAARYGLTIPEATQLELFKEREFGL